MVGKCEIKRIPTEIAKPSESIHLPFRQTRLINKKQKGTKEYYFEKRKLPLNEDDALIASTDVNYFRSPRNTSKKQSTIGAP